MILFVHTAYYFFSVKEFSLVLFDEILNKSLSTHLEEKVVEKIAKDEDALRIK